MPISEFLLSILVCPVSHKPLVLDGQRLVSTDPGTRRSYRIDPDGDIPVMLVDESEQLTQAEWEAVMAKHGNLPETEAATADESTGDESRSKKKGRPAKKKEGTEDAPNAQE